jgi:hypothetical protein
MDYSLLYRELLVLQFQRIADMLLESIIMRVDVIKLLTVALRVGGASRVSELKIEIEYELNV